MESSSASPATAITDGDALWIPGEDEETCALCENGKFQRLPGQTSCETCIPGVYCKEGAAEPVP